MAFIAICLGKALCVMMMAQYSSQDLISENYILRALQDTLDYRCECRMDIMLRMQRGRRQQPEDVYRLEMSNIIDAEGLSIWPEGNA